jgi:hypothetical protein
MEIDSQPTDLNSPFTSPLKRSRENKSPDATHSPTSHVDIKKIKIDSFFSPLPSPAVETGHVASPAPSTPITVSVKPTLVATTPPVEVKVKVTFATFVHLVRRNYRNKRNVKRNGSRKRKKRKKKRRKGNVKKRKRKRKVLGFFVAF